MRSVSHHGNGKEDLDISPKTSHSDPSPPKGSRISGFHRLTREERISAVANISGLSEEERNVLTTSAVPFEYLDTFIENAVGSFPLPLGIATNFIIDGVERLIPMAVEETSVVAAASLGALLTRDTGGFHTDVEGDLMIGQIELFDIKDPDESVRQIRQKRQEWIDLANFKHALLVQRGGGCRDIEVRVFYPEEDEKPFIVVHLLVAALDAMGANVVTKMCESVAPKIATCIGAKAGLKILSNFADQRVVKASCGVSPRQLARTEHNLSGEDVRDGIVRAYRFADVDPYRAATHNKGIMNGIDPVAIATGNDWRAIEAGAHAYAARSGRYRSLSRWWVDQEGLLRGELRLPLQVGIVGGVTSLHPLARISLRLLKVESGKALAQTMCAVGLAQNLSALRALSAEGLLQGHMRLHARKRAIKS